MNYYYTIACTACGAIRSHPRGQTDAQLDDAVVLAQAVHDDSCMLKQGATVSVDTSTAANVFYSLTIA